MPDITTRSTFPHSETDAEKRARLDRESAADKSDAAKLRHDKIERDADKRNTAKIDKIDHDQVDRTDLNPTDRPEITVGVTGDPQDFEPTVIPGNPNHDAQPDQTPHADTNLNPNPDKHGDPATAHLAAGRAAAAARPGAPRT